MSFRGYPAVLILILNSYETKIKLGTSWNLEVRLHKLSA